MKRKSSSPIYIDTTFENNNTYTHHHGGRLHSHLNAQNVYSRAAISRSVSVNDKKKRLFRRMSESFVPNCVLVPNKDPTEDLYKLFPQLPDGEKPINGFSCALHKDILLQGKMTICSSCICFHSNIFGYETRVIIFFKNVLAIKREKTAFVVPNAISIRTLHKRYLFCSLISRENSFKLLSRTWKHSMALNELNNDRVETNGKKEKTENSSKLKTDFNRNTLLSSSSSSSYNSSFKHSYMDRPHSYPDRPHTSPPTINPFDSDLITPQKTLDNIFDPESDNDDDDNSNENTSDGSITNLTDILADKRPRCRSLNNLGDISTIGHQICFKNLQVIKKRMETQENRYKTAGLSRGRFCTISKKLRCYGVGVVSRFYWLASTIYSLRVEHPIILLVAILILLLALLSFNLLWRINALSDSLETTSPHIDICENIKLKNLFGGNDNVQSEKVEKICKMLTVNIDMVDEVQSALKRMRSKLNVNG